VSGRVISWLVVTGNGSGTNDLCARAFWMTGHAHYLLTGGACLRRRLRLPGAPAAGPRPRPRRDVCRRTRAWHLAPATSRARSPADSPPCRAGTSPKDAPAGTRRQSVPAGTDVTGRPLVSRRARLRACKGVQRAQCRSMMHYNELVPAQASALVPDADRLQLAAAAYLARFKGTSPDHASSDLRCYLAWRAERGLDPFLRIFEATGTDISDLGEEHRHRVLRVCGKAARSPWSRCPRPGHRPRRGSP
jgi:hypothetical protein